MTAIVTGASSGIGRAVATELCRRGCLVVMACRDLAKAERVKALEPHGSRLLPMALDLSSPHSIEEFLAELAHRRELCPFAILVNNAGLFGSAQPFTSEGLEMHFAVNHLGHFVLTTRLLALGFLEQSARVVLVASSLAARGDLDSLALYKEPYSSELITLSTSQLYANSKLANCLFARELHTRCRDHCMSLCVQTDGMAATDLFRNSLAHMPAFLRPLLRFLTFLFLKSPYDAAQNAIHCSVASEHFLRSGAFYSQCRPISWPEAALHNDLARQLWETSEQLSQRFENAAVTFSTGAPGH